MSIVTDPDSLDRFQIAYDPVGELISIRGLGTERHGVETTGDSDGTTTFTDTTNGTFGADGVVAGDVLTIISDPAEDGGIIGHYRVVGSVTATTFEVDRNIVASTSNDLTYKVNAKEATGGSTPAVADGVDLQALFSFSKEEWITLAGGLGNAEDLNQFDFPYQAISSAAGQYIMGGVNGDAASAWAIAANNGTESTDVEGIPRELIRSGGWQERDATDVGIREYANYTTLGSLDSDAQAYYQQGDTTGDPADFKLTGAVNQAVLTLVLMLLLRTTLRLLLQRLRSPGQAEIGLLRTTGLAITLRFVVQMKQVTLGTLDQLLLLHPQFSPLLQLLGQ
jgi:hypothetical protein